MSLIQARRLEAHGIYAGFEPKVSSLVFPAPAGRLVGALQQPSCWDHLPRPHSHGLVSVSFDPWTACLPRGFQLAETERHPLSDGKELSYAWLLSWALAMAGVTSDHWQSLQVNLQWDLGALRPCLSSFPIYRNGGWSTQRPFLYLCGKRMLSPF